MPTSDKKILSFHKNAELSVPYFVIAPVETGGLKTQTELLEKLKVRIFFRRLPLLAYVRLHLPRASACPLSSPILRCGERKLQIGSESTEISITGLRGSSLSKADHDNKCLRSLSFKIEEHACLFKELAFC